MRKTRGKIVAREKENIELKGKSIESFERVEEISEVILLGKDGGIRRIILGEGVFEDE